MYVKSIFLEAIVHRISYIVYRSSYIAERSAGKI